MPYSARQITTILFAAVVLFFISPYLFLIAKFQTHTNIDWKEFVWVCQNTLLQSFLSALIGTSLGFLVALGILKTKSERLKKLIHISCFVSFYVPTLFFVLSLLQVWKGFPMGIAGVVIVHTLMNFGLAALVIQDAILNKAGPSIDLAVVLGSNKWTYIQKILLPLIRKDLIMSFASLFIFAFLSFSVPLLVGGQKVSSFEIMIYEIIRYQTDWSAAIFISIAQSLFLGLLFFLALKPSAAPLTKQYHQFQWVGVPMTGVIALAPLILMAAGYILSFTQAHFWIHLKEVVNLELFTPLKDSLLIASSAALWSFVLNGLCAFLYFVTPLPQFVRMYLGPTSALTGFGILVWGNQWHFSELTKLTLAYVLIYQIYFLRIILFPRLAELQRQHELSVILGASEQHFFLKIVFPSLCHHLFHASALLCVWVLGDFAIMNMIAKDYSSMAQLIERLTQRYRIDQALILSTLLGIVIFIVYSLIQKAGHVLHQKLMQKL